MLTVTKIIEFEIAEHYYKKNNEVIFVPVGNFKPYDGISQSKQLCFEVKFESQARDTFNLCIEYSFRGKPSGIASTEADKWVHVVPVDQGRLCCYEFDIETLKEALKNYPLFTGGDGKKSQFKLLPLQVAEKLKKNKFYITINWTNYQPYWS